MFELPPYSVPCLLRTDQVLGVVSLLDKFPYSQIAVKSVKGTGTVKMRIILSRDTDMRKFFWGMRDALNPSILIDKAVREGVVFSK